MWENDLIKHAEPNGLQRFFGGARKVTGFLNNPLQSAFPSHPASAPIDNLKNVASQVVSPKPFGIASNIGLVTQIPGWIGTAGAVNTGINTADQLFEYGEKGFNKTLNDMKTDLTTKHFQNPVVDTGNDVLKAVSRPLVSVPLGVREGIKAIAPAFKYNPGIRQSSPMHGATALMNMNKRAFIKGMLKAAAYDPHADPAVAGLSSLLGMADPYGVYKDIKNQKLTGLADVKNIDKDKLLSFKRVHEYSKRSLMDRSSDEKLKAMAVGGLAGGGIKALHNLYDHQSVDWKETILPALLGAYLGLPFGGMRAAKRYNKEVIDNPELTRIQKTSMTNDDLVAALLVGGAAGLGTGALGSVVPEGATEAERKKRWKNALIAGTIGGGVLGTESLILRHFLHPQSTVA